MLLFVNQESLPTALCCAGPHFHHELNMGRRPLYSVLSVGVGAGNEGYHLYWDLNMGTGLCDGPLLPQVTMVHGR